MSQRAEVARLLSLAALAGGYAAAAEYGVGPAPKLAAALRELEAALRVCDAELDVDMAGALMASGPIVDQLWGTAAVLRGLRQRMPSA